VLQIFFVLQAAAFQLTFIATLSSCFCFYSSFEKHVSPTLSLFQYCTFFIVEANDD